MKTLGMDRMFLLLVTVCVTSVTGYYGSRAPGPLPYRSRAGYGPVWRRNAPLPPPSPEWRTGRMWKPTPQPEKQRAIENLYYEKLGSHVLQNVGNTETTINIDMGDRAQQGVKALNTLLEQPASAAGDVRGSAKGTYKGKGKRGSVGTMSRGKEGDVSGKIKHNQLKQMLQDVKVNDKKMRHAMPSVTAGKSRRMRIMDFLLERRLAEMVEASPVASGLPAKTPARAQHPHEHVTPAHAQQPHEHVPVEIRLEIEEDTDDVITGELEFATDDIDSFDLESAEGQVPMGGSELDMDAFDVYPERHRKMSRDRSGDRKYKERSQRRRRRSVGSWHRGAYYHRRPAAADRWRHDDVAYQGPLYGGSSAGWGHQGTVQHMEVQQLYEPMYDERGSNRIVYSTAPPAPPPTQAYIPHHGVPTQAYTTHHGAPPQAHLPHHGAPPQPHIHHHGASSVPHTSHPGAPLQLYAQPHRAPPPTYTPHHNPTWRSTPPQPKSLPPSPPQHSNTIPTLPQGHWGVHGHGHGHANHWPHHGAGYQHGHYHGNLRESGHSHLHTHSNGLTHSHHHVHLHGDPNHDKHHHDNIHHGNHINSNQNNIHHGKNINNHHNNIHHGNHINHQHGNNHHANLKNHQHGNRHHGNQDHTAAGPPSRYHHPVQAKEFAPGPPPTQHPGHWAPKPGPMYSPRTSLQNYPGLRTQLNYIRSQPEGRKWIQDVMRRYRNAYQMW